MKVNKQASLYKQPVASKQTVITNEQRSIHYLLKSGVYLQLLYVSTVCKNVGQQMSDDQQGINYYVLMIVKS